jgi:chromosome partitioning protein
MAITVSFVSQKGGVGKSALARALAVVVRRGGLNVLVADLDYQQATVVEWEKLREANGIGPAIAVRRFKTADDALIAGESGDVLIIDGPARATAGTLKIAEQSHLIVQPSGCGLDDLRPTVLLFHELLAEGIARERMVVALSRTASESEEAAARRYVEKATYQVLAGSIPERLAYREAFNRGQALTETTQPGLNARAQELMDALLKKVRVEVEARTRDRKEA